MIKRSFTNQLTWLIVSLGVLNGTESLLGIVKDLIGDTKGFVGGAQGLIGVR